MSKKFYVTELASKKSKTNMLCLVEIEVKDVSGENVEEKCNEAVDSVRDRLPFMNASDVQIRRLFDLNNLESFKELQALYFDQSVRIKILISPNGNHYLTETNVIISDLWYHCVPTTVVHIQSRHIIMRDKDFESNFNAVNLKLRTLLACEDINFTIFETNLLKSIDDIGIERWVTILKKNDLCVVFHRVDIDTIIGLAKSLYELSNQLSKYLRFFFVDNHNDLYQINITDRLEVVPMENNRDII